MSNFHIWYKYEWEIFLWHFVVMEMVSIATTNSESQKNTKNDSFSHINYSIAYKINHVWPKLVSTIHYKHYDTNFMIIGAVYQKLWQLIEHWWRNSSNKCRDTIFRFFLQKRSWNILRNHLSNIKARNVKLSHLVQVWMRNIFMTFRCHGERRFP